MEQGFLDYPNWIPKLSGDFEMLFSGGLFDLKPTQVTTPVKPMKHVIVFPQHPTTTPYGPFDAESQRESYDV